MMHGQAGEYPLKKTTDHDLNSVLLQNNNLREVSVSIPVSDGEAGWVSDGQSRGTEPLCATSCGRRRDARTAGQWYAPMRVLKGTLVARRPSRHYSCHSWRRLAVLLRLGSLGTAERAAAPEEKNANPPSTKPKLIRHEVDVPYDAWDHARYPDAPERPSDDHHLHHPSIKSAALAAVESEMKEKDSKLEFLATPIPRFGWFDAGPGISCGRGGIRIRRPETWSHPRRDDHDGGGNAQHDQDEDEEKKRCLPRPVRRLRVPQGGGQVE
mmetsp:Transcript_3946/g.9632  ORF Transcript_3946/g.9632 Transcript_3946/m.9632 type:complete len:268 (+) Transcript_3946:79-882(+)